jgi:hypothetical protein
VPAINEAIKVYPINIFAGCFPGDNQFWYATNCPRINPEKDAP